MKPPKEPETADEAGALFVRTFLRRERRDRLLYELSNPKKRYRALDRFCHGAEELIDPAKITLRLRDKRFETWEAFLRFAAKRPKAELCRVLSPDPALDGLLLPLSEAAALAALGCDAAIIVGPGAEFAVVFGEAMKGGRGKYFLTKDGTLPPP